MSKKILYVIGSLSRGGAERHLCMVLPMLKERGFDVSVFCLTEKGELAKELIDNNINVICKTTTQNRFFKLFQVLWHLNKYFKKNKPDIVHSFLPASYILAGFSLLFYSKIKFIMSRRSLNYYQQKYPLVKILEKFLHKKTDYILGNSKAVVNQLKEEGVNENKLGLIYNGIDAAKFDLKETKQELRKKLGIKEDCLTMVIVANLFFYKGHSDLIKALELAKKDLPKDWQLLIVGKDIGEKINLIKQAEEAGILDNLNFLGSRTDIVDILKASDIGFSSSHEEGFSNSVLEMMASSLVVVATDAGGNSEAVGDAGIVVPIKDSLKMKEAIIKLLDEKLRTNLGNLAYQRVLKHFSLTKCVNDYENCYKKLLDN